MRELPLSVKRICESNDKLHLDFLCVGFQKCGTTSLQRALEKNSRVFLPKRKETFFCTDINDDKEKLLKRYYPVGETKGRLVGGIEPTYYRYAEEVYQYFGNKVKIIFCMDAPVKALFSAFKMHMRDMSEDSMKYFEKYLHDIGAMFNEWAKSHSEQFHYARWIKDYMGFFDRANMLFVVSSELYGRTDKEMERIQRHIGLADRDIAEYKDFPYANKGIGISKNMPCAKINRNLFSLWLNENDTEQRNEIDNIRNQVFEITTKKPDIALMRDCPEITKDFQEDIAFVENITGRSLKGKWYE